MHDKKPEVVTPDAEVTAAVERLLSSDYCDHIRELLPQVKGRMVRRTLAGSSGFVLEMDDGAWVASYLSGAQLEYTTGHGVIATTLKGNLNSSTYGDPSVPLDVDMPYAAEPCNLSAEVAKCVGQRIEGLAIGANSFNFCFPRGLELETLILPDDRSRPTLRVFWEQW